ncbi:hypothetical protein ACFLZB_03565 [Nanoarchaeota archaeon]
MNPLTHVKFNDEVFKGQNLTQQEKEMLYLGSIIPDLSEFHITTYEKTHFKGLQFLKDIDKKYFYFAAGVLLHGEQPRALDYLAHSQKGYINSKRNQVLKIVNQYKNPFGRNPDINLMVHYLIEFAFDYLVVQEGPSVPEILDLAIQNGSSPQAIWHFADFFDVNKKKLKTVIKTIQSRAIRKYIYNFRTLKGSASNFQKFLFIINLKSKQPGNFASKFGNFAFASLGLFKKRLGRKQFTEMFEKTAEVLRKDYSDFTKKSITHLKKLSQQHKLLK